MNFDVLVLKEPENGYVARPLLWPDSAVQGATQQEALERVRLLIRDLIGRTQIVQVEVDVPEQQELNAWQAKAGTFAVDPTWDDFIEAMADYRRQVNIEPESEFA